MTKREDHGQIQKWEVQGTASTDERQSGKNKGSPKSHSHSIHPYTL